MTFNEILPALKAGGRATRPGRDWVLERVHPSLPDGRQMAPVYAVTYPGDPVLVTWGRSDADVDAADWELL